MSLRKFWVLTILILTLSSTGCQIPHQEFEKRLEKLRSRLHIPGMVAAVSNNGSIIWSSGFGYADVQKRLPATDSTVYHLASLTKPFASVILMQLVEKGKLNLDDPLTSFNISVDEIRRLGIDVSDVEKVHVRHVLTHTARGEPGSRYAYSGDIFTLLDNVISASGGRSFTELLMTNIITPLNLNHTVPNIRDTLAFAQSGKIISHFYKNVYIPYKLDSLYRPVPTEMETYFGVSAGLMSTTTDLIRFSEAIYNHKLLKQDTWLQVFSPNISTNGDTLPYALGWFVQKFEDLTIQWHYGYWNTNSSLIIRIPEKKLTFVLLAATNQLSRPFGLGDGDVIVSPFATAFIREFVFPDRQIVEIDLDEDIENITSQIGKIKNSSFKRLIQDEILADASIASVMGQTDKAQRYYSVYAQIYTQPVEKIYPGTVLAEIAAVGDDADQISEFTLMQNTNVQILVLGEGIGDRLYDYGWLENAEGDTLWEMTMAKTENAGGAGKNRLEKITLNLDAGTYSIGYRTDESHSYNRWNAQPPDIDFYGIRVLINARESGSKNVL